MGEILKHFTRRSLEGAARRPAAHGLLLLCSTLCLYGVGAMGLAGLRVSQAVPEWVTGSDVVVYLRAQVPAAEEHALWEELKTWPELDSVRRVTRDDAYARLEKQLGPWKGILSGVGRDHLQPSLEVTLKDPYKREPERREEIVGRMRLLPDVSEILYGNGGGDKLESAWNWVRGLFGLAFGILALFITFAHWGWTLVMISGARDELKVQWWVGAPDWMIYMPFLLSSWAAGALGSIMAQSLVAVTAHFLETRLPVPLAALFAVDRGEWLLLGGGMTGIVWILGTVGVCLTAPEMRRLCSNDRSS